MIKLISTREAPNPCINIGSALLIEGENCLTNVSLTCRKIATSLRCSICPWCNGSTAVSKTVRSRFESLGACHLYKAMVYGARLTGPNKQKD